MLQRLGKLTRPLFIFQESQALHAALEQLNNTVVVYQKLNDIKLLDVDSAIGNLSRKVTLLENSPLVVKNLDKRENLSTIVVIDGSGCLLRLLLPLYCRYSFSDLAKENVRVKVKMFRSLIIKGWNLFLDR